MRWSNVKDDSMIRGSVLLKTQWCYGVSKEAAEKWLNDYDPDIKLAMHPNIDSDEYAEAFQQMIDGVELKPEPELSTCVDTPICKGG